VTSLVRRRNDLDDAFRAAAVLSAADRSDAEKRQIPVSDMIMF
jgi:hypothetical protein